MPGTPTDRRVSTERRTMQRGGGADRERRLPNERDESPSGAASGHLRGVMRQAADDLEQGLVDTDLHNTPGVERAAPPAKPGGQARPHDDAGHGMRGNRASSKPGERK
jgi:hypothetical protein